MTGGRPLTEQSAIELAAAIRERRTSARAVLEAHLDRHRRFHASVNAIVVPRFEAARAEADAADARVAAAAPDEPLPPLLGVPFTVKELFGVEGMPQSGGLVARREVRARTTATVAARMRAAGGVLVGLTNSSELSLWLECENRVYGRTSNPYDPRRTSGGSSGGEAAAIACGASAAGVGTDTGGSIRVPAFCCGVFGHKPSRGLIPLTGSYPEISGLSKRLVSFGPLARRAEDLMPLLRTLAGPDGADDSVRPAELGDPGAVALEGLRVRIGERRWARPLGRDVLAARDRATDALAAAGARVERIALPDPRRAVWPGAATLGDAGSASVLALLDEAGGPRPTVLGALRRDDPYTTPLRIMALLEPLYRRVPERQLRRAVAAGERFGAELTEAIGDGVLLHPPLAGPAPRHGRTTGRPFYFTSALAFNIAPVPVTQVPLGLGRGGLPVGIQVAAGPGRDHVAIAVALQLERALGGWSPPAAPR